MGVVTEGQAEPEPEPEGKGNISGGLGEKGQLERAGSGGSGGSGLEPYYAYGGCKRCLVLADEIDGMRGKLRST